MKKFFSLLFLLAAVCSYSQNPYTVTTKYLTGDCLKPDTVISTTVVTGKSGYFSSKVTQTAVSSIVKKLYQAPVVIPANHAPTITISGLSTITQPVTTVTLTATVQDVDNNLSGILWEKVSGGPATVANPTGNPCLFQGLSPGQYLFRATATDKGGLQAIAQFAVNVIGVSTTPPTNPDPPPVTSVNPVPTSTPFTQSGFEGSDPTTGFNSYAERPKPGDLSITTAEARTGNSSARFHINQADVQATGSRRVELTLLPDPKRPFKNEPSLGEGSEIYVKFSLKIKEPFVSDREFSIFQMHHDSPNGSPPCALYINRGSFAWYTKRTADGKEDVTPITPYKVGVWQDILIHLKFSSTGAGLSEVWIDGLHYSNPGANLFPGITNFTKLGPYEWIMSLNPGMNNTDQTFYIDDFAYWLIK